MTNPILNQLTNNNNGDNNIDMTNSDKKIINQNTSTIKQSFDDSTLPFYSAEDVAEHKLLTDCWVSMFSRVYNLTPAINCLPPSTNPATYPNHRMLPIISASGTDISHWFDSRTRQPKRHWNPETGLCEYDVPFDAEAFLHLPPIEPLSNWPDRHVKPWWESHEYCIGRLSNHNRQPLNILNVLTSEQQTVYFCREENFEAIIERFLTWNENAENYTWKYLGKEIDVKKSVEENGIYVNRESEEEKRNESMDFIPTVHIFFNDDFRD
jgi:hypothetical protein